MNLFIVESPLQLLCAFEAIKSHPNTPYKLLIRYSGVGSNDMHLQSCVNALKLEHTSFTLRPSNLKIDLMKNIFLLIKIISEKYHFIFLGSIYSKFLKKIKTKLNGDAFFYLDDGAATIVAQSEINRGSIDPINWFTFFNLSSSNHQSIHNHNFEHLKERYQKNGVSGSYFIGQPIEKMIGYTLEDYKKGVDMIAQKCSTDDPLIYIQHRAEDITVINDIRNIRVLKIETPLELYFLQKDLYAPEFIYGFYSTALITLKILFPNTISSFISSSNIEETNYSLQEVLSYFRDNNIKEININN